MPSFTHELLVDLFRYRGELAPALLAAVTGIRIDHARVEQASIDLSQAVPTTYSADNVVILRATDNTAIHALIVEVQLGIDAAKRYSWPSYVTNLRAQHRCPVLLLVLAPSPRVARWARTMLETGHPGFNLEPVVIELADIPRSIDPETARMLPELAVLSMLAHPTREIATTALASFSTLPEERRKLYYEVIMETLAPEVRRALAANLWWMSVIPGTRRQMETNHKRGRTDGLRAGLRLVVQAKLDDLTAGDEARIEAVRDARTASKLIRAVTRAATNAEVRALLSTVQRTPKSSSRKAKVSSRKAKAPSPRRRGTSAGATP